MSSSNLPAAFKIGGVPQNAETLTANINAMAHNDDDRDFLEGCELLKMRKDDGSWFFGQDEEDIDSDSEYLIFNPSTVTKGFICWSNDEDNPELLKEVSATLAETPINKDDLPSLPGTWKEQMSVQGRIFEDSASEDLIFKPSSKGGCKAVRKLLRDLLKQMTLTTEFLYPIVKLTHSSYKHKKKKYGTIFNPVFKIEKWVNAAGEEYQPAPMIEADENAKAAMKAQAQDMAQEIVDAKDNIEDQAGDDDIETALNEAYASKNQAQESSDTSLDEDVFDEKPVDKVEEPTRPVRRRKRAPAA